MKLIHFTLAIALVAGPTSRADALVLTFDDIPMQPSGLNYYTYTYGVSFDLSFAVVDHTGSPWGPPRSWPYVLAKAANMPDAISEGNVMLKGKGDRPELLHAYSFGMYFSTEYGAALEMIGYSHELSNIVASAEIGGTDQAWQNVYAGVSSPSGKITGIILRAVTPGAFAHFCADDATIQFVPEPSSLAFLALALASVGIGVARRRR